MYKVIYTLSGSSNHVVSKWFKTLTEANEFANKQPIESVLEIKYYADSNNN
jgi:hypothetical protein